VIQHVVVQPAMFVFLDENEPACGRRSPESRRKGRGSRRRGRGSRRAELEPACTQWRGWQRRGGFHGKQKEATRASLPATAEPGRNERIFRFSRARPRGPLRGLLAWLVGRSKQTNSLGCTPWAQWLIWTRQTNIPLLIQLVALVSARKAKVCVHAFIRMSVHAHLKDFNITHKPL